MSLISTINGTFSDSTKMDPTTIPKPSKHHFGTLKVERKFFSCANDTDGLKAMESAHKKIFAFLEENPEIFGSAELFRSLMPQATNYPKYQYHFELTNAKIGTYEVVQKMFVLYGESNFSTSTCIQSNGGYTHMASKL
ncbi:MAG: hypothetical protein P0S95_00635 [Rhabdochlamydiaceae bacterium]|nr:hypothetical protein [Candidatus Amphrikana amoebophyrae]